MDRGQGSGIPLTRPTLADILVIQHLAHKYTLPWRVFVRSSIKILACAVFATFVLVSALLTAPVAPARAETGSTTVALDYESTGWSYDEVAHGAIDGFEQAGFDASNWSVGAAGFGTTDGICSWNNSSQVGTNWDPNTDMLLRHTITLPAGATNVHVTGTVDNNADVYLNGDLIGSAQSGNCQSDAINMDVSGPLTKVGSNLLAIRASDQGDADYIDIRVTYDALPLCTNGQLTSTECYPTGLARIDALNLPVGGEGVGVVIIDGSGVSDSNPDLVGAVNGGKDCRVSGSGAGDQFGYGNGHATAVAGVIAARKNGVGIVGVAPNAIIHPIRVNQNGFFSTRSVDCALKWSIAHSVANGGDVGVVDISSAEQVHLGVDQDTGACGSALPPQQLICSLKALGVIVVVSAGDNGANISGYWPTAYNQVVSVSALADDDGMPCGLGGSYTGGFGTYQDDTIARYSDFATTRADKAHMASAPGTTWTVGKTTKSGPSWGQWDGASFSAPFVAGVAALYKEKHPDQGMDGFMAALQSTGEYPNVNYPSDCSSGAFSHTDPRGLNPEPVIRAQALLQAGT